MKREEVLAVNASGFSEARVGEGLTLYASGALEVGPIESLSDVLNPVIWKECFRPFACVVVDRESRERVLIRDHLGVAPLYYALDCGKLVFGDNLPDILRHLSSRPPWVDTQINELFSDIRTYSDETFYQGVYRVEPGHILHLKANGSIQKRAFWQLTPEGPTLHYQRDGDYLEHFSELMREAIQQSTRGTAHLAAEFSAGIDSTAVYCAAMAEGLEPKLYMHAALPGSESEGRYNDAPERAFFRHFPAADLIRIIGDDFDPIAVFRQCAEWFAGPAPYIFFMFAHELMRTVAAGKHSILLSGFGGDQGVSMPAPLQFFLPTLIHQKEHRAAWRELRSRNPLFKAGRLAMYAHPALYRSLVVAKNLRRLVTRKSLLSHPYYTKYFRHMREAEWTFLQGPLSNEIRMRIEYSSVMAKKFGFEYRYPLLYPKLLEFFLSLPPTQKRRDGNGRYLIRRYLAKFLPSETFDSYRKREGLGIIPGTFELFRREFERGAYQNEFSSLPHKKLFRHREKSRQLKNSIKAFMLKTALESSEPS